MSINLLATTNLIVALNDSDYTTKELAELTGLGEQTARDWINLLHKKKVIYVSEWRRSGKIWVAVYSWGYMEEDFPKPKPMSMYTYNQRSREKKRLAGLHKCSVVINERKSNGLS